MNGPDRARPRIIPALVTLLSVASVLDATGARAADDPFLDIPREAYCDGYSAKEGRSGRINGPKLLNALLSKQGVSQEALDRNADGTTTYDEKLDAALLGGFCKAAACQPADQGKLNVINSALSYFTAHPEQFKEFSVRKLKSVDDRRRVRFNATPGGGFNRSPSQTAIHPIELLDPSGAYVDAVCLAPAPRPTPQEPPAPKPKTTDKPAIPGGWRVAGQADHLADGSRAGGGLTNVTPADFSIGGDRRKGKTDGAAKAYGGYSFAWYSDNLADRYDVLPYAYFERSFKRSRGKRTEHTNLVGVGVFGELMWAGEPNRFFDYISFSLRYDTDLEQDTRILSGQLAWVPALFYASPLPVDRYARIGDSALMWRVSPKLIAKGGRAFDDGGFDDIESKANFLRVGGEVLVGFTGIEGSLLSQFELTGRLVYQYGVAGPIDHYRYASIALKYVFPEQKNWVLKLEYANGRHETTLEKLETWRASVGFRL